MSAILTRRARFSAAHRLSSEHLSDSENENLFGKCFNPNGHGHNYEIEVSVRGSIDAKTGLVMNLSDLKSIIEKEIISRFDHKNLNLDTEEFSKLNPTAENIAAVCFKILSQSLGKLLYEVRIKETENNFAIVRAE